MNYYVAREFSSQVVLQPLGGLFAHGFFILGSCVCVCRVEKGPVAHELAWIKTAGRLGNSLWTSYHVGCHWC
jgi:hypothetical protein